MRSLPPEELALASNGLHLGRAVDESKADFGRGDFVIRNVIGVDKEVGAVAVGDLVDVGTTVQFHIRDAASADEDLRELDRPACRPTARWSSPATAGARASSVSPITTQPSSPSALGHRALAGMFCAGELGPVGGHNFLHGYTASLALFTD